MKFLFIGEPCENDIYLSFIDQFDCIVCYLIILYSNRYSIPCTNSNSQFYKQHLQLTTRENFIVEIQQYPDTICIYASWQGFAPIGGLDHDLIAHLPRSVKLITTCATGVNGYDLTALHNRGIHLANTPSMGASDVADTALFFVLESVRSFGQFHQSFLKSAHTVQSRIDLSGGESHFAFGHELDKRPVKSMSEYRVTIVGLGSIGLQILSRLQAFNCHCSYVKRTRLALDFEIANNLTYYDELIKLAPCSDIVILSLPGTPETDNLVDKSVLDKLPQGSKLINIGRGSLINEDDVLDLLNSGQLSFYGADVFQNEPAVNAQLIGHDKVYLTPHIVSSTWSTFEKTSNFCLQNILNYVNKGEIVSKIV